MHYQVIAACPATVAGSLQPAPLWRGPRAILKFNGLLLQKSFISGEPARICSPIHGSKNGRIKNLSFSLFRNCLRAEYI
ncbi:hypothetical protein DSECCO2_174050 [anaerobic digester metagenome]